MIFLTSITVIVCLLLLAITLGRRITDLLPVPIRDTTSFYLAPLLGLAAIILITTVYGWMSPFKTGTSLTLALVILLICIKFEKQRTQLFQDWLVISAFAIVASISILAPALRFDSFNPFNDTFTYLVHGQWLQSHAFSEVAQGSGYFPAITQVVQYQSAGHRMGSSFFFGFVQSLFHLEWSYYAYLATVGLTFALGSLAIGAAIQQVTPVSRKAALILCTLPAFSMNGFVFGAQYGFFPQTFGIAFAAGLAGLIPGLVTYILEAKPTWSKLFQYLLPLTLCCSALLFTYNDMFPVLGAGIGLFLVLVTALNRDKIKPIALMLLMFAVQVMLVINVEGVRIIRNFVHTLLGAASGAVHFGWPVLWSPVQFVAHSFGLKSAFANNVFWADRLVSSWIFPFILIAIIVILVKILRAKPRNFTILLLICINVVYWMAFLKFRYATPGLDGEVGNTFLQFKLAKWLAPFNLGLLGIAIAWILNNAGKYKNLFQLTVGSALAAGLAIQLIIVAQMFTQQFQDETMQKYSPFNVFLDLRSRVASIPKDQVIYLGIPNEHQKVIQMVAYTLSDRKLAGKYEDGYIRGNLPENERDMPIEMANWMIQLKPSRTADENPLNRVGPFFIRQAPFSFYNLDSVQTAYGTETGNNNTWNWVKDTIEYRYKHVGITTKSKVKFQYLLAGNPRTLTVDISSYAGKKIASFDIAMKGGWAQYESPWVDTNSEDIVINLKADGDPIRLSETDSRMTKFLVQNITVDSAVQTPNGQPTTAAEAVLPFANNVLESVSGGYNTESSGNKTWNWVKDSIEYTFRGIENTHKSKIKFQYLLSGKPRTLFLDIKTSSGKRLASQKIRMKAGWGEYEGPAVSSGGENVIVHLWADGSTTPISATDSRATRFLVQNLIVESGM